MKDKSLDASYSYRTYAGCLEGKPSTKSLIEEARRHAIELWGKRPTLLIEPIAKSGRLPRWTHMVWATGPAKDDKMHGSELVVIWHSELEPETIRVLDVVDWNRHAEDFEY